jgi:hypothetical protein
MNYRTQQPPDFESSELGTSAFLYWNIQINGIWHQAGGLNPVSKLVFVKIENNNLLCVVLIKTIVCDMH